MSPRFSIVTVVLNPPVEEFLRTVASVLGQREGNWELIIKDGGSDPACLAAIPSDPRIRVITEKDSGIFDAMNQALDLVTGEFICFLNAGDWFYDSSALSHVAAAVASASDADFIYGDVAKPSSRSGFERYADVLTRSYLFDRMICHQAWFVSSRYYARPERYETELPTGADRRFLLRMVLLNHVRSCHVPKVLVGYRGGGVSQKPENARRGRQWADQLRREIYSPAEYRRLSLRTTLLRGLKRTVYDTVGWRIWRRMQAVRSGK